MPSIAIATMFIRSGGIASFQSRVRTTDSSPLMLTSASDEGQLAVHALQGSDGCGFFRGYFEDGDGGVVTRSGGRFHRTRVAMVPAQAMQQASLIGWTAGSAWSASRSCRNVGTGDIEPHISHALT